MPVKLKCNSDGQEGLLTTALLILAAPWLAFLALVTLTVLIYKIHQWREAKKTPAEKLKDTLSRLDNWVDDVTGNSNDEIDFHDGFSNTQVDESRRTPNLTAIGIISLATFKKYANKLQKCTHALASSDKSSRSIKKIDAVFKQNFSKNDIIWDGKKPAAFKYDTTKCRYPDGEWYKDFTKCANEMSSEMSKFHNDLRSLIKTCESILDADTEGVSKEDMLDRVAFIETSMMYADLIRSIHDAWDDNIRRLCAIDIVWKD